MSSIGLKFCSWLSINIQRINMNNILKNSAVYPAIFFNHGVVSSHTSIPMPCRRALTNNWQHIAELAVGCTTGCTTGCIMYTFNQPGCTTRLYNVNVRTACCTTGCTTRLNNVNGAIGYHYQLSPTMWNKGKLYHDLCCLAHGVSMLCYGMQDWCRL
jgi:hypothetical protein